MKIKIEELWIYPIKGCQGISLKSMKINPTGPELDRMFMLVNEASKFISQRNHPILATLKVEILNNRKILKVSDKTNQSIEFSANEHSNEILSVKIWNDICQAQELSKKVSEWFSKILGTSCKLVKMSSNERRIVSPEHSHKQKSLVRFSDGFPFLLTNTKSLSDLNSKMNIELPMSRFRSNIIVSGEAPFEEDHWDKFKINNLTFYMAKLCSRCLVINIDQNSGEKDKPKSSPLMRLSKYRNQPGKGIIFGVNLIHSGSGAIHVGDIVEL